MTRRVLHAAVAEIRFRNVQLGIGIFPEGRVEILQSLGGSRDALLILRIGKIKVIDSSRTDRRTRFFEFGRHDKGKVAHALSRVNSPYVVVFLILGRGRNAARRNHEILVRGQRHAVIGHFAHKRVAVGIIWVGQPRAVFEYAKLRIPVADIYRVVAVSQPVPDICKADLENNFNPCVLLRKNLRVKRHRENIAVCALDHVSDRLFAAFGAVDFYIAVAESVFISLRARQLVHYGQRRVLSVCVGVQMKLQLGKAVVRSVVKIENHDRRQNFGAVVKTRFYRVGTQLFGVFLYVVAPAARRKTNA